MINKKDTISDKFYWESTNTSFGENPESPPQEWINIHFKTYPRLPKIPMLRKTSKKIMPLLTRRSERSYSGSNVTFELFSKILYTSAGITTTAENINYSRRTYPSAGARYPLEIYIVSLNVSSLKEGLYHFNVKENLLEILMQKSMRKSIIECTGNEKWLLNSSFIIIITGVPDRSKIKYSERGFRYMLIEAGHLAQNLCLLSRAEGLDSCTMGGYIEEKIISLLDIGNVKEYPLYMISFGTRKNE